MIGFSQTSLEQALLPHPFWRAIYYFPSIDSTNDVARQMGAPAGNLWLTDEQTRGKGRAGRLWQSPAGAGLTFTVGLPAAAKPPHALGMVSLLGAWAVCRAITDVLTLPAACRVRIKWPNDVWVNDYKVCGVLPEAAFAQDGLQWLLLGIGVNVNGVAPAAVRTPSISLESLLGTPQARLPLLQAICQALWAGWQELESPQFLAQCQSLLQWQGEPVGLYNEHGIFATGELLGLAENGALRLQTAQGARVFAYGELSLRKNHAGDSV